MNNNTSTAQLSIVAVTTGASPNRRDYVIEVNGSAFPLEELMTDIQSWAGYTLVPTGSTRDGKPKYRLTRIPKWLRASAKAE
jgi:hypothetical protein